MSWKSVGVGAGVGALFGGPIGALIGAGLGSWFSSSKDKLVQRAEAEQLFVFTALFGMLAKIAKADGIVSEEEARVIKSFMDQLGLDARSKEVAGMVFAKAKDDDSSVYDYAAQFSKVYENNQDMRIIAYRILFQVAASDGELHPEEDKMLRDLIEPLGLDASMYNLFAEEFFGQIQSLDEHYALLDCTPDSSDAEVKKAYRKKCIEYHPDKVMSKGLPESFVRFADEQMKMITCAYDQIKKARPDLT
ncbi:MAG: TerB family tellurite resistance protein [Mariprofundus sp.]|nr:TerB family tellurite resistance protein [Mariprofundus sp.]